MNKGGALLIQYDFPVPHQDMEFQRQTIRMSRRTKVVRVARMAKERRATEEEDIQDFYQLQLDQFMNKQLVARIRREVDEMVKTISLRSGLDWKCKELTSEYSSACALALEVQVLKMDFIGIQDAEDLAIFELALRQKLNLLRGGQRSYNLHCLIFSKPP
jgi:hypothetical protein